MPHLLNIPNLCFLIIKFQAVLINLKFLLSFLHSTKNINYPNEYFQIHNQNHLGLRMCSSYAQIVEMVKVISITKEDEYFGLLFL